MKYLYRSCAMLVLLSWLGACHQKATENPAEQALSFDLSNLHLDFSGLEIDFELLFKYDDKEMLIKEAEDMFPLILKDMRDAFHEDEDITHVLVSMQLANGKAKLKELLMYDSLNNAVLNYHNYTTKLGAIDGVSPNQELLSMVSKDEVSDKYVGVEQFAASLNQEQKSKAIVHYIKNNYQSDSEMLDLVIVVGSKMSKAYGK